MGLHILTLYIFYVSSYCTNYKPNMAESIIAFLISVTHMFSAYPIISMIITPLLIHFSAFAFYHFNIHTLNSIKFTPELKNLSLDTTFSLALITLFYSFAILEQKYFNDSTLLSNHIWN